LSQRYSLYVADPMKNYFEAMRINQTSIPKTMNTFIIQENNDM
jgi:hypothetical protein